MVVGFEVGKFVGFDVGKLVGCNVGSLIGLPVVGNCVVLVTGEMVGAEVV